MPDYGTNLWIAQVAVASGNLTGIGTNTQADIQYDILSRTNLVQTDWQTESSIFGSETTNWTPFSVARNNRTNLIIRLRSDASSDGSGLPDWWELEYFGTNGVDPYGNPAGDGYSNLQKFQNGMNPNVFYTPAAPQNLKMQVDATGRNVTLSWQSGGGNVNQYEIDWGVSTMNVPSSQNTATVTLNYNYYGSQILAPVFNVKAKYPNGASSATASIDLETYFNWPLQTIVGSQGQVELVAKSLPSDAVLVHFFDDEGVTDYDVPVSNIVNGVYTFPATFTNNYDDVQILRSSGQLDWEGQMGIQSQPFYDGRSQLKENLIFQLRNAVAAPLHFTIPQTNGDDGELGAYVGNYTYTANYAYAGLYQFANLSGHENYGVFDPFLPFEENCMYRNFVFNASDIDSGGNITTGLLGDSFSDIVYLNRPLAYQFRNNGEWPDLLLTNESRWFYPDIEDGNWIWNCGLITYDTDWNTYFTVTLANNYCNWFGLPYVSTKLAWGNTSGANVTVNAGQSAADWPYCTESVGYPETAQPQFQTAEYDFWIPANDGSLLNLSAMLPGNPSFSETNQSQLLIVSVGTQIQIAGYAKLAVVNGCPGVYGYLGQYFDKAYKVDDNGNVTTNQTGVLSPYGYYFATDVGVAALVTMPDIDTGERGTCMVYSVSLQLDKNHDGTMDTSFNGPDATSQASPMEWWVNNDNDGTGTGKDIEVMPGGPVDYQYGKIRSQRNLEDFSRLWICGLPKLPTTNGYAITLSLSVVNGSPAINLYRSYDANGSASYLSDTNAAAAQFTQEYLGDQLIFDYSQKVGTISSNLTYTLPVSTDGTPDYTHFLFEGAGIGEGQLTMTISQNGNTLSQSSVWLDLHDVKDFYEQTVITNNTSGTISNWSSGIEIVQPAISSLGDDTNLIVFVHGINVDDGNWRIESDTVFKRLYWAGYQGRFTTVKWPCNFFDWSILSTRTSVFNQSEAKAYKAGAALKIYIDQLHARFPDYRLNLFVHSQGNAVVSEAIEQGASFDTYILTQGAMPASAYDAAAPTDAGLLQQEAITPTPEWQPMGYHGIYTNMPGRIVNYYNTNDPVLGIWMTDQGPGKPDGNLDYLLHEESFPPVSYYSFDGANSWYNAAYIIGSHMVTDPQESRAMVSRSRTRPIGQSPPESGHGVITSGVDLYARYGFFKAFPDDHSAQWTWPIQKTTGYYLQILNSIKP
jgi:hypothetical protein